MDIRRAGHSDMGAVNRLLGQVLEIHAAIRPDIFISGTKKYTDEELDAIFVDPDTPVFVAEEEGEVLGYCFCEMQECKGSINMRDMKLLYIDDLCVDERARGRHVGRALYDFVLDYAKKQGCYSVTLHVWEGNDSARAFYDRMGFGIRKTLMEKIITHENDAEGHGSNLQTEAKEDRKPCIYTVTLNPSLDYLVTVDDFRLGLTNRTSSERIMPGGKGINVSIALKNLGIASVAYGFQAGFTGDEIAGRLADMGISTDFVRAGEGVNRINVKLLSAEGTEINGAGPRIDAEAIDALLRKLDALQAGDILVLSGSVPLSVPSDIYTRIMERLKNRSVEIVVDAADELLKNALSYHPFLIKPNRQEMGELFETEFTDRASVIPYAKKLQELGARNVLVSMGCEGAVLLTEGGTVCSQAAPAGQPINTVGAGDSMVAGFLTGWTERRDYEYAFRMGLAAGSASAFSESFCTRDEVEALLAVT